MNTKHHYICGYFVLGTMSLYQSSGVAQEQMQTMNLEERVLELKKNISMGKYQEAADLSKKLLLLDSSNNELKDFYALSIYKLNNYSAITNLYTQRQAEYIDSPLQLKLRTIALSKQNDFLLAMTNLRLLKNIAPLNPEWKAFYHYLVFKINPESSFKELARMSRGSPKSTNDLTAGKLYLIQGKKDEAIKAFNASLEKDPVNVEALEYSGDYYFRKNKLDQSISSYTTLLNVEPQNSKIKIKLAKAYVKNRQILNAIKLLETDANPEVAEFRSVLLGFANNLIDNPLNRSIAEENKPLGDVSISEDKVMLVEKFYPKDIDIYADSDAKTLAPISQTPAQVSLVIEPIQNSIIQAVDISLVDLSVGMKAKKYDLTGVGFTAKADYSTGFALNGKYTFFPAGRPWNTQIILDHSSVIIKELSGLTPSKTTLSETRLATGYNYLIEDFYVGPVLMYEKTSATLTAPNPIRGNIDFFNIGIKGGYSKHLNNNLKFNLEANYYSKIMSVSKTTSIGTAEKHSLMDVSSKVFYEMRPSAYYFVGLSYSQSNTQYSSSSSRGTSQAEENENEFTFPMGINYAF